MKKLLILTLAALIGLPAMARASSKIPNVDPGDIHFSQLVSNKQAKKKEKHNKEKDDKLRKAKKPADLNRSKRADKMPVQPPRTIIVV